jgi:hypothetical protein
MITISALMFFFLAAMALACILVLQALSLDTRLKAGYTALAVTYVLWVWQLYGVPIGPSAWWLYALPMVWLILLFRYGFSGLGGPRQFPSYTGEPSYTEEALRGAAGTREALTFYFLLLLIALILGLVFYELALLYR